MAADSDLTYFDLENPIDLARLSEPMTALKSLRGLVDPLRTGRLYRVAGSALRAGPGEIFTSLQDITHHCP